MTTTPPLKQLDLRVGEKYRLERRIGSGSFGAVYLGINDETGEEVAIKLEHCSIDPSVLRIEADIYKSLTGVGIPRVHWYGYECEYNVMVFDLLGPSLEDLFNFCQRDFSLKTVLMLADQLISRLEYIHSKGVIHRDIKPENFLMGVGRQGNQVYVTDLGLATEYDTVQNELGLLRPRKPNLVGTARFASVNGHIGHQQSRRDDMEALGYMILYFLRGVLPWQGLKAEDGTQKEELIMEKKKAISIQDLCDGCPKEFSSYFEHVRSLGFGDKPKYSYLRRNFRSLFIREGFEYDHVFDWTIYKYMMLHPQNSADSGGVDA